MDLFTTNTLIGVVQDLKALVRSFLVDRYFPTATYDQTEEIHFDVIDNKRRLAPFVSPVVAGKVVETAGYNTKTFKPAYVKPKQVWDPNQALKRPAGQPLASALDPMNNTRIAIAAMLQDQVSMIKRRLEVMAAEALRAGTVTVSGDQYPTVVVNFGRAAGQTIVKAAGTTWDLEDTNVLDDLLDWQQVALQACGALLSDVIMTPDVWKVFRINPVVKERLATQRRLGEMPSLQQGDLMNEGGVFMGTIDNFNIFVYSGWYRDANDAEQPIIPAKTAILTGPQLEGVQAFGAVRDEAAGYRALDYFPKSWVEQDPPVRYVMTQSAPLMVPRRVNASLSATVLP